MAEPKLVADFHSLGDSLPRSPSLLSRYQATGGQQLALHQKGSEFNIGAPHLPML